jgi:hypothetical protein
LTPVLVKQAKKGDLATANMIADRLDGKPHQSLEVTHERTDDLTALFDQLLASAASGS